MRQFCEAVHVEVRPRSLFRKGLDLISSLLGRTPYIVKANYSARLVRLFPLLLDAWKIQLVQIDELAVADNALRARCNVVKVLDAHNCEGPLLSEIAAGTTNPVLRWFRRSQARKLTCFERSVVGNVDAVAAVSQQDFRYFSKLSSSVCIAENAVPGVSQRTCEQRSQSELLFVGTLSYPPNEEGLLFFIKEVLPLIEHKLPDVTLRIIGRRPGIALKRCVGRRVTIDSDVDDLSGPLSTAGCMVVPLKSGGGSRLKILEAFAAGLPVVSTAKGAEGLRARHGEHFLLADAPQEIAEAITLVLNNADISKRLSGNAEEYVKTNHLWSRTAKQLDKLYSSMIEDSEPSSPLSDVNRPLRILVTVPHLSLLSPQGHRMRFDGVIELLNEHELHFMLPNETPAQDCSSLPSSNLHFFNEPRLLGTHLPHFLDFSNRFQNALRTVCAENQIDLVVFDFPWGLFRFRSMNPIASVYLSHGVEKEFAEVALRDRGLDYFPLNRIFKTLIGSIESKACHLADLVVTMSERDAVLLAKSSAADKNKMLPLPQPVELRPNAADSTHLREKFGLPAEGILAVFHGSARHLPNRTAVRTLEEHVAPVLEKSFPDTKIVVAGPGFDKASHSNLIYLGFVDDLAELLKCCDLAIVPVTEGSGVRMKIFDYFCANVPVASTKKGVEGIPITNGTEAIIAENDGPSIVEAASKLIRSAALRREVAKNARQFVMHNHSEQALKQLLWRRLSEVLFDTEMGKPALDAADRVGVKDMLRLRRGA